MAKKKTTVKKIKEEVEVPVVEETPDVLETEPHTDEVTPPPLSDLNPPKPKTLRERYAEYQLSLIKPKEDDDPTILIEKELRRYIRKDGGYRKGLSPEDKERCRKLMGIAGRNSLIWDKSISIKGMDKPTVANIVFKKEQK